MISSINNSSLAYIPVSQLAKESTAPALKEHKDLHSQPSQSINYSQSISTKSSSQVNNLSDPESNEAKKAMAESEAAQQQDQVKQVIDQLKARDREVRTHEMAHLSAAGSYAIGGMNLSYQKGPDGQQYAVGGSVQIDTSAISGDPEATLQKGRVVQQAALAPAEPSGQDRKVASAAAQLIANAQTEILKASQEELALEENEKSEEVDGSEQKSSGKNIEPSNRQAGTLNSNEKSPVLGLGSMENTARMQFDMRIQVAAG